MNIKLQSKTLLLYLIFIISIIQITSCKKEAAQAITPAPSGNKPPVANAGSDQTITLPINAVTLDGSKSTDPDNNITNYLWTNISGSSGFTIANANATQTQVNNLVEGVYLFELKVTNNGGASAKSNVVISVFPAISYPPNIAIL